MTDRPLKPVPPPPTEPLDVHLVDFRDNMILKFDGLELIRRLFLDAIEIVSGSEEGVRTLSGNVYLFDLVLTDCRKELTATLGETR